MGAQAEEWKSICWPAADAYGQTLEPGEMYSAGSAGGGLVGGLMMAPLVLYLLGGWVR